LLIDSRTAAVTHDRELFVGFITPARRM